MVSLTPFIREEKQERGKNWILAVLDLSTWDQGLCLCLYLIQYLAYYLSTINKNNGDGEEYTIKPFVVFKNNTKNKSTDFSSSKLSKECCRIYIWDV